MNTSICENADTLKRNRSVFPGLLAAASLGCVFLAGCSTRPAMTAGAPPAVQLEELQVGNATCLGMKLLTADGRPFAFLIRADRGIVACPHFAIGPLGKAGLPAATAKNWKQNGIRGELREPILAANEPAAALGIKPGMTVEEALGLLRSRGSENRSVYPKMRR